MAEIPKSIGWIGLGLMGTPMATNLFQKTEPATQFYVYDVVQDAVEKFEKQGQGRIHACNSAKEVADKSDMILSMVPEGSHVRSVYLDSTNGVLASKQLGSKILVDCSTIDTGTSIAVRDACAAAHPDARFYDAPVSGGVLGAERATLTLMLGCARTNPDLALLEAVLSLMGGHVVACGGPALGLTAKLCNNYVSGLATIALSEAMDIAIRSGMDPRVLANVFHTSTAQSAICDDFCPVPGLCPDAPASKGYQGGFRVQLMKKDFGLAVDAADRVGAKLVLGANGLKLYADASEDPRCKDLDSRVVYRFLGGREDWRQDFPDEVEMKKDETRRAVQLGREQLQKKT